VIEYGEFERVGSTDTLTVDVRLIAATHRDLPREVQEGRFRHDLLDRVAFEVLTVPPLRARQEDIPLLAEHFGRAMSRELGRESFPGFVPPAMDALLGHPWPGNVRELKNVVERAIYRAPNPDEPITGLIFDPFASPFRPRYRPQAQRELESPSGEADRIDASRPLDFRAAVADLERRLLEQALKVNQYNQRATARHLNLTYDQLRHQLKKHGFLDRVPPE
jgi:psp operon transcriptional activator